MVMWTLSGGCKAPRLGVVASRKIGGAVARNRAKRLLRECFRLTRDQLHPDVALVLVARRPLPGMRMPAAREEYLRLAKRAGVLKEAGTSEKR
jgi:ribonuclease P protein component